MTPAHAMIDAHPVLATIAMVLVCGLIWRLERSADRARQAVQPRRPSPVAPAVPVQAVPALRDPYAEG